MQARKSIATALILIAIAAVAYAGSIGLGFKPAAQPTPAAMPAGQYSLSLQGSDIRVEPGTTVEVGEEVYFDGRGVTIAGAELLPNGMIYGSYTWDFGDGYYIDGGTAISHFYTRAGTYTVTLNITDINDKNKTVTTTIQVTGEGPKSSPRLYEQMVLELTFEGNLDETSGSGLTAEWKGGDGEYADGTLGQAADLTNGAYIEVSDPGGALSGMDELEISLWAKRKESDSIDYLFYLLDMGDAYYLQLKAGWPSWLRGYIITGDGSAAVENKNAYVKDTLWHHYVIRYDGSIVRLFIDEVEYVNLPKQTPAPLSGTVLSATSDSLLIGKQLGVDGVFDGYIDEVRIYKKVIEEFELWHADFHGHTAQYIYAQIPSDVVADSSYGIKVEIVGDTGYSDILLEKNNLQPEEKFLLNNSELPRGNYTLTAQLIDPNDPDNHLDEIIEKFEKPYDGIPKVGIDENNAIRIRQNENDTEGKLFFPVTPWLLSSAKVPTWASEGYINTLYNTGWYAEYTPATWKQYLDKGYENNLVTIGPGRFEGKGTLPRQDPLYYERNTDPNKIIEYVEEAKDHPGLLMWMWDDEPDLGSDEQYLPPTVLRAWTYLCHRDDPQHLVALNYAGRKWTLETGWNVARRKEYEYLYNEDQFGGKKTHITDVLGFDYYPIDWEILKSATVEMLADALDTLRDESYNLLPYMSFVETTNIRDDVDRRTSEIGTPPPTPEQLRMLIWLNVVHGVKGINWFHYFTETPTQNYEVMAEFLDQITRLTPVVLSGEPNRTVTDNANTTGNRVDTMIKEHEGNIYIFAVRLTEVSEADDPTIDVTFNIEGINEAVASVFDDSETINVASGQFQDTFAPNDVHIYTIPIEAQAPECINTPALLNYISQWKQGQITMLTLMGKIALWKAGC